MRLWFAILLCAFALGGRAVGQQQSSLIPTRTGAKSGASALGSRRRRSRRKFQPRHPGRPQPARKRRQGSSQQRGSVVDPNRSPSLHADVQEIHPWNPYRAVKDIEVGDFYFKRKSYGAALDRYQDALIWKEKMRSPISASRSAIEKLDQPEQATHTIRSI